MKNKVLVVDDVEINRDILEGILEEEFEVLMAQDGIEALKILEETKDISVMLLDILMPRMDGFEVLKKLKENNQIEKLPVIIISGDDSVENETKCFDFGIVDFIKKPFNAAIVRHRVDNVVTLYSYRSRLEEKVAEQTRELSLQYEQLKMQALRLAESNQKIIECFRKVRTKFEAVSA